MRISIEKFKTIILMLSALLFYYLGLDAVETSQGLASQNFIVLLSWVGIVFFTLCLVNWKKITGAWFSLYLIYFVFLCLFMFGQCFMWALGIHDDGEIGKMNLFRFGVPATEKGILTAQLMSILGVVMFHGGVSLFYKNDHARIKDNGIDLSTDNSLFLVSCGACIVGTLATFYLLARNIVVNRMYGYGAALYNADVVSSQNNIILLARMLFFPALVGMLVGSHFKNNVRKIVYALFTLFTLVSLFAGDRGEWIFPLLILSWMHHNYVKKIDKRKIILFAFAGVLLVCVSVAVRNVRSDGVTLQAIIEDLAGEENPIVSAFFEFGRGMQHSAILMERGWNAYPYGNTYILAFLGMVTDAIPRMLIGDYQSLSTWYSSKFLSISYGAGFSIIAEGLVNFGPYFFWVPLFFIGAILSRASFNLNDELKGAQDLSIFMKISITYCAIQGIRNTTLVSLKTFMFSTVVIYIATILLNSIRGRKA